MMKTQMKTLRQDLILEDVEDSEGTSANAELRPRGIRTWSVCTRSGMLAHAQHMLNSPGKTGIAPKHGQFFLCGLPSHLVSLLSAGASHC